jgi:hypothetical protein
VPIPLAPALLRGPGARLGHGRQGRPEVRLDHLDHLGEHLRRGVPVVRPDGGRVDLATPLKQEARDARPVVAVEDFTAAQRLADLARAMQLEVAFEHVPLDGAIDLKRPNLIVICGPRLSQEVANVLAQDPVLRFEQAPDGPWTLRDLRTGEQYRSGSDLTPARLWDAAYLGRLPRPDGQGSVLVFTGIHPPGTLGVVQLLASELTRLYEQVGTGEFSTLVGVDYDPASHEPVSVQLLTPLYAHTKE